MRFVFALTVLVLILAAPAVSTAPAQTVPAVFYIGFAPSLPPADLLTFRLAIAYAIDRDAVAKAVAPHSTTGAPLPASNIEHPRLPSYNPAVRGHSYDPAKAKELFTQSGWTSPISVLTGPGTSGWGAAAEASVAASIRNSLGASFSFAKVASFDVLTSSTRSWSVPMFMYGWYSSPRDFGYPSFAMGLAHEYYMRDPDVRALGEKGSAQALEQLLLDKAYLTPIIFYMTRP